MKIFPFVAALFFVLIFSCKKKNEEVKHHVQLQMRENSSYAPSYLICSGISPNGITSCYNQSSAHFDLDSEQAKKGDSVKIQVTCSDPHHDFELKYFLDGNLVQSVHIDSTRSSGALTDLINN